MIGSGRSNPASLVSVAQKAATTALMSTQNSARAVPIERSSVGQLGLDDGVEAGDVPADELERQTRLEHDVDGVRVGPHVVLGDRVDVADVVGDGTHHHGARDAVGERGVAFEGRGRRW